LTRPWRQKQGLPCPARAGFAPDQGAPGARARILRRLNEGEKTMSTGEAVLIAGIVLAFVAFIVTLAWGDYASHHPHHRS
jgi:hypothetical protein